ncbi:MAG: hypothetical protein QOI47_501, partial [Actinomycetota bacterium]|nr:hypothetical protein [Actinomycetota bacterium]
EGLTYAEIADRLEVPQTTVEALLFRARKALRREFLAVSGEGRLASVPLVGALVRRLAAMRDRAAGLMPSLSQLAGPVAAGAAAAVLAAAPFAPAPQASHRPARAAAIAHVASTSAAPPSIDSAAPSSATGAAPHANVSPRGPKAVPGVQKMSSGEARRNASSMPVLLDIGGAGAGADPNAPVTWVTSYLSGGGR